MNFSMTGQEKGDHMGRFDCIYTKCTCVLYISVIETQNDKLFKEMTEKQIS